MDKNAIKKYAVWARRELISRVSQRAALYEITDKGYGDASADSVLGRVMSAEEKRQRQALIAQIREKGYEQVMEEVAYTWFNRFAALRFMEVNGYLPSHVRVFTNDEGEFKPQILSEAIHLDLDGLNMDKVYELKNANKDEELFKYLLIVQCNALNKILPGMFQKIEDFTELLLPDYLLREGSVIEKMISEIPEDNFDVSSEDGQIEIIGWLYQYYIFEKHEEVVDPLHGKVVKKEEVPAATQLFTTDWVVRYLVDNSVGRYWIERNPVSNLADELTYYVKPQNGEVKYVNEQITPQDVTVLDPCVGSGHFLVYAFEVLMKIYVERGYSERDAASEIVKNNLFGLDIDARASQLAYFAVMMKARQYDRRFFSRGIQPNIYEIKESNTADRASIEYFYGNDAALRKDVETLLDTLKDAKEYGSILQMPDVDYNRIKWHFKEIKEKISIFDVYLFNEFQELMIVAEIISNKYAVVATNPPYLNKYDDKLKSYINSNYCDYKGDLFSVFIYRGFNLCKSDGYTGFMTPMVWMFIKTYEELRKFIIEHKSITTLIQFEYSAFEEATVPICAFVLKNGKQTEKGLYFKLSDFRGGMSVQRDKVMEALADRECGYYFESEEDNFSKIPGTPIAYWVQPSFINAIERSVPLGNVAFSFQGIITGDNKYFLRLWHEVSLENMKTNIKNIERNEYDNVWVPYNKGGEFRRWYGNNEYLLRWINQGKTLTRARTENSQYYFREGVTWSFITSSIFSCRYFPEGALWDVAGSSIFATKVVSIEYICALMNSKVAQLFFDITNPTINYQVMNIISLPYMDNKNTEKIYSIAKNCIQLSKEDWDSYETSWDFRSHPLAPMTYERQEQLSAGMNSKEHKKAVTLLSERYRRWEQECEYRFSRLKKNEEELNRIFIDIYGLQDELTPDVEDKDVTVRKADLQRDIKSLISYAVGCMFGRYSIYKDGLIFAGEPYSLKAFVDKLNERPGTISEEELYRAYTHEGIIVNEMFYPDQDNILPICDDEYFEDDIVSRFVKFVEFVYGKETLEENLKFIADALGGKGSSREVIRSYFLNDFYADHLKIYQKSPIYWLFDSGKKNGFKCLIYMHRYQPDTIARIRTDYVHEQQSRYRTAIADLESRIANAGTDERIMLSKQLTKLQDQTEELRVYEEKIHHLADQMIRIDLDDGVKHNYAIFQDVLAKIK